MLTKEQIHRLRASWDKASDPVSSWGLTGMALPPFLGECWRDSPSNCGTGGMPASPLPSCLGRFPSLSFWASTKDSLCPVYPLPRLPPRLRYGSQVSVGLGGAGACWVVFLWN